MTTSNPVVEVRGLCFAYAETDVLHDVAMELRGGELVAVAGPNGSGKSTLMELIADVLRPRRGTIRRRGDLALVLQRTEAPDTLPVTARDVVAMGTWKRGRRMPRAVQSDAIAEALDRVGMTDLASRPLASLSGGQRQRIFLAQGIVRKPDILLLDEPAAGLDRDSIVRTQGILAEEAARGAAVACVTHHESAVSAADRVVRLDHGVLTS